LSILSNPPDTSTLCDLSCGTMSRSGTTSYPERRLTGWVTFDSKDVPWKYGNRASNLPCQSPGPSMIRLRSHVESALNVPKGYYDCALVNHYNTLESGMKWHSDPDQLCNSDPTGAPAIFEDDTAVLSLGLPGVFRIRRKVRWGNGKGGGRGL
jgi:alkylated DNA repair dioxygenase AlkB